MTIAERLKGKAICMDREFLRTGEIPSVMVVGDTLPEVWENSVIATLEWGCGIPTQYDQEIDPESKDATMMMVVMRPLDEPRIHKALPCGYQDLETYRQEVVEGIHDYWVGKKGWSYSYHDRLFNYPGLGSWEEFLDGKKIDMEITSVDQINSVIKNLVEAPHTRRAQAITWVPWVDSTHHEPPCLQRIWCRVVKSEKDTYLLEMNTHWRSRDAFKAAFMNMYALTDLQKKMAGQISVLSGKNVEAGRYVDVSDSYHLYGSYQRKGELDKFVEALTRRDFSKRVVRSDDPSVVSQFEKAKRTLTE